MELIHSAHKASEFEPEEFISNMPDNVIPNILDRLPLQYAVRTSILSRNWRLKWTMLSQLVFDAKFLNYLSEKDCKNDYVKIISRLLLHVKGAIRKFVLLANEFVKVEDVSHWILFLSTNGIKDLTIYNMTGQDFKLPTYLFSCLELTHLNISYCILDPPTSFHGFPNLMSLELSGVGFESGKYGKFFTQCPPVLEILNSHFLYFTTSTSNKVELADIATLASLKRLSFNLCNLDNTCSSSSIFELIGSFPILQELHLGFHDCKFIQYDDYKRLPTTFPCLKTLRLLTLDLSDDIMLSFAFKMLRSLPNLQTFDIIENNCKSVPASAACSLEVDYNTMGLLQLQSVVVRHCKVTENEVCLIKCLLACSPFLKKIRIRPASFLKDKEKLMFAKKFLRFYRASPFVDIDIW